jgi:hypothetical protein
MWKRTPGWACKKSKLFSLTTTLTGITEDAATVFALTTGGDSSSDTCSGGDPSPPLDAGTHRPDGLHVFPDAQA